jgi:outer membrane protein OmpA-like peptidoglycan-associated protein
MEAERVKREHDTQIAAAQAEADRLKRESDVRTATAQAEADRLKLENEAKSTAAQAEADRLKRENDAQRATAQADLDRAAGEKAQAEADKAQLRAQLLAQFNAILQTRDTARGLIVNMSDVLFDTAKFSLRPAAREKLARVAGILSGHPSLRLQVEGYTDSVGSDDYNQLLSEHRAEAVRDYLMQAGIESASVTAKGFGKTQPVAPNNTSAGRQQNRRVELVISGEIIGTEIRPSPFLAVN